MLKYSHCNVTKEAMERARSRERDREDDDDDDDDDEGSNARSLSLSWRMLSLPMNEGGNGRQKFLYHSFCDGGMGMKSK